MGALNFQTGKRPYTVNDGAVIYFDPSDAQFAGRIIKAFQNCSKIQNNGTSQPADIDELVAATEKMVLNIKTEIDGAFGDQVCDKVFGGSSPIAIADGLPVWTNFLMAVIDEIDRNTPDDQARTKARVQQYMTHYEMKYGKYVKK